MDTCDNQDLNNLSTLSFKFQLNKIPNVEFRVQSVSIPGIDMGRASAPNPYTPLFDPGNIEYGPLSLTFLVGQQMNDYLEIFEWMIKFSSARGQGEYERDFSDGSVLILNPAYKPVIKARFTNMYPISISPLEFNSTEASVEYIRGSASFNFDEIFYDRVDSIE